MMRKPQPDRFSLGEEIAAESPDPVPSPTPKKPAAPRKPKATAPKKAPDTPPPLPEVRQAVRPGVRPPNTAYERLGRIYVKCPKALCRALDRAVLSERERREPTPMDKGIAIEEAVRLWLQAHGYPTE